MTQYYPVMLDLDYKKVVIVGGGSVALQKVKSLLETKAVINVVSPALHPSLSEFAEEGLLTWRQKCFEPGDLDGAVLSFAATDQEDVNEEVESAAQHWQLLNRVDGKGRRDFITPATVRKGPLIIAVSTSGASPAVARKISRELSSQFDHTYEDYFRFLAESRAAIIAAFDKGDQRREALKSLLEPQILEWTREGNTAMREAFLLNLLIGER